MCGMVVWALRKGCAACCRKAARVCCAWRVAKCAARQCPPSFSTTTTTTTCSHHQLHVCNATNAARGAAMLFVCPSAAIQKQKYIIRATANVLSVVFLPVCPVLHCPVATRQPKMPSMPCPVSMFSRKKKSKMKIKVMPHAFFMPKPKKLCQRQNR